MSADNVFQDADVVWVKLGSSWWPGEVCGTQRQPEGFLLQAKRKPYCVVKFFQEDSFEYVKSSKHILHFNCSKKEEFIRKGHELFIAKKKFMEKFPSDVSTAERLSRSVTRSSLFFNSRPNSIVKAILGNSPMKGNNNRHGRRCANVTTIMDLTPNRNSEARPSTNSPPTYKCSMCSFQSTRQNVMILHRKSHSGTAATSSRTSLVPRSATKSVSVSTSPPPIDTVLLESPIRTEQNSPLSNDDVIVISDESDYSLEEIILTENDSQASVAFRESDLSSKQNDIVSIEHSSPVHKKEDTSTPNEKVCNRRISKSEEIRKRLLADWIDEEEDGQNDDAEENTEVDVIQKPIANLESYASPSAFPNAASEQLRRVMPVDQNECVVLPDPQKPQLKIRNIPKKDRRNIVLADFNNCDQPQIVVNAKLQQADEHLPVETSSLKVEHSTGLPSVVEPFSIKTSAAGQPATDVPNMQSSTKETFSVLPHTSVKSKVEPYVEKLNVYETEISPEASANINKPAFIGDVVQSPIIETSTAVPATKKPSALGSSSEKSYSIKLSVKKPSKVKSSVLESPTIAISIVEPSVVKHTTREELIKILSPTEEPFTVSTSKVDTTEESAEREYTHKSIVKTSPVESTTEEPPTMRSSAVQPTAVESSTEESPIVELCAVISTKVKLSKVKQHPIERPLEKSSIVEPSTLKTLNADKLNVKALTFEAMDLSTDKGSSAESFSSEPFTDDPSIDEQNTVNISTGKALSTKLTVLDLSTVKRSVVESADKNPSIYEENPNAMGIGTTETLTVQSATVDEYIDVPIERSTEKSSAIESHADQSKPEAELSTEVQISAVESLIGESAMLTSPAELSALKSPNAALNFTEHFNAEQRTGEVCTLELPESSIEVPVTLETKALKEAEETELKTVNTVSKASLSCFDFQEEEDTDILTSIAKFKKKYISPEKNYEFGKDSRPKTPDPQKLEMEFRDKQLSADIESLLKTTALPIDMAAPSCIAERSISHDVRGLPIKERGKRIFKSRNRFRGESCPSVSTTSALKIGSESSPSVRKESLSPEIHNAEQSDNAMKSDLIGEELSLQNEVNNEDSIVMSSSKMEETMDGTVTNSDEEIVGRVVFSAAEVYAPPGEDFAMVFPHSRESHVSSSGMEVHTEEAPFVNDENSISHFKNDENHTSSDDGLIEITVAEDGTEMLNADSCGVDEYQSSVNESKSRSADSRDAEEEEQSNYEVFPSKSEQMFEKQELVKKSDTQSADSNSVCNDIQSKYNSPVPDTQEIADNQEFECQTPADSYEFSEEAQSKYSFSPPRTEEIVANEELVNDSETQPADSCNVMEDCIVSPHGNEESQELEQDFIQEEVQQDDNLNSFFVVEENEPIYEVEIYDADVSNKMEDADYETINHELSNIVRRITGTESINISEQNIKDNVLLESVSESSDMVACKADEQVCKETIPTNCNQLPFSNAGDALNESQDSSIPDDIETENTYVITKDLESTAKNDEPRSDESNSCSTMENQSKDSNVDKDIHIETLEEESIPAEVEHAETSSDDTSTVISDAEAEFGSPTSMLEEERVLNRARSESVTPTTNFEYVSNIPKGRGHTERALKKRSRFQQHWVRKEKKHLNLIQHYDTQESASNDVEQNTTNKDYEKQNIEEKDRSMSETFFLKSDLVQKAQEEESSPANEKAPDEKEEDMPNKEDDIPVNEDYILESNVESDSAEEEEEEICSPPIEPLQDESMEEVTIEQCLTTNSSSEFVADGREESNQDQQFGNEIIIQSENILKDVSQFGTEHSTNTQNDDHTEIEVQPKEQGEEGILDKTSEILSNNELEETVSTEIETPVLAISDKNGADIKMRKLSNAYYTITKKSDTIITLNKHKEKSENVETNKEWNETDFDSEKSDIACEELNAAEALLLIPNQTSSILDNSQFLPYQRSSETPSMDDNTPPLAVEIKEEILNNEPIAQSSEQKSHEDIPKEVLRRKRRSHMKMTPRKRVIDVHKFEKPSETGSDQAEAKVPKLNQDPQPTGSKIGDTEPHRKTFAEQYEENFVLKYMKEKSIDDNMDSVESTKMDVFVDSERSSNSVERQAPEKVHITVDISNPLSSQIASILGTHRPSVTEVTGGRGVAKKRKQTLEDDIPSFIIKRPDPKNIADAEAADRETIAQIQNLCPHVEITRKPSKDDQTMSIAPFSQLMPQIINQQIVRSGTNQPIITVTAKSKNPEEGIFDISSMPIVLSSEAVMNEKLHLVITPTSNPQLIKQFQNQQQLLLNPGTSTGGYTSAQLNIAKPGIPNRRASNVKTKRTPTRQQLLEQQNQEQLNQQHQIQKQQHLEHENKQQQLNLQLQNQLHLQSQQQQLNLQQQYHQQHQQLHQSYQHHSHQPQQQHHPPTQKQHQRQQQQFRNHHFQQQFQLHQQSQAQLQLQHEQQILLEQHQQQLFLHHHQQQQLAQQNPSEKQMGVDTRGNKYVIIKAPSNTVVMGNNSEPIKGTQRLQQLQTVDALNANAQKKQRQSASNNKKAVSQQLPLPLHPQIPVNAPLPHLPQLPHLTSLPHLSGMSHPQIHNNTVHIRETHSNEIQQHFNEKQISLPSIPVLPTTTAKVKGQGRGRRAKDTVKTDAAPLAKENTTTKISKNNANGRRSSGSICDPPRQRSTRSAAANKKNISKTSSSDVAQSIDTDFLPPPIYTTAQQHTQSVVLPSSSSIMCANNMPFQVQSSSLSPPMMPRVISGISIETSDGSGVGYAVPSLPVPGYPPTFLLCELIGKKYKEVSSKPLYLSQDRTRFFEVPDEFLTDAHRKLTDCRREPNPDVLQVVSDGIPHILHPRVVDSGAKTMGAQIQQEQQDKDEKANEVLMQRHEQFSVVEQASALLCLQEEIAQEQLTQEQFAQKQLAREQLVKEQLMEQLVQDQSVQDSHIEEQIVHDPRLQEQFVQDQFMQQRIEGDQRILQDVSSIETEEVHDNIIQQMEQDSVVMEESVDTSHQVVLNIGDQQIILEENAFLSMIGQNNVELMNTNRNTYTLTPEAIHELLNSFNGPRNLTTASEFDGEVCEQQQIVMDDNMLPSEDTSPDILTVALDESGLYAEEQFINSNDIVQIETPDGIQLIGTAGENAGIVFHPMPAKTNETNVLLNQANKMSILEDTSNKTKPTFETNPSTAATLEDCLHVMGATGQSSNVPTSLDLPTSATNAAIVSNTRTPTPGTITMNEIIATGLCHHPDITSLPPMGSNEQELHYEFFPSSAGSHNDKVHVNEESVVADMGEYTVSNGGNFDDPGR